MMNINEYKEIMLENNYKNFDNDLVVLIAYNMYKFIVEQLEKFKSDFGIRYSDSAINSEYMFEIKEKYSIFISRIQNLNKEQLKGFSEEIVMRFSNIEEEFTYYNNLRIINNFVFYYENWIKKEKDLFD